MKHAVILSVALVAVATLSACSANDFCSDLATAANKKGTCDAGFSSVDGGFSQSVCEKTISVCTAADKIQLNLIGARLGALPACQAGSERPTATTRGTPASSGTPASAI